MALADKETERGRPKSIKIVAIFAAVEAFATNYMLILTASVALFKLLYD